MANPNLEIVLCVAGMPFDGNTVKTKSLGGSESAGYYMARALAKRGHRVKVFTNTKEGSETDGVQYLPLPLWHDFVRATNSDVHIVQRMPELMAQNIQTKLSLLWCHDLALKRSADQHRMVKWSTDKVLVLSQFHKRQFQEVIGYADQELYVTRNGFDFDLQPPVINRLKARDPDLFVYCARPERGLENLIDRVAPQLLALRPSAKFVVCTYDNMVPEMVPWLQELANRITSRGLPFTNAGALTKAQLYQLLNKAAAYLYPTPGEGSEFREISCIAALEAQACGLPFLHTGWGALTETVQSKVPTVCTIDDMGRQAAKLVLDPQRWQAVQSAGLEHVRPYSWDTIAGEWEAMFFEQLDANNDCPFRLARWFYKRSEIEGAELALDLVDHTGPLAKAAADLSAEIKAKYAFRQSEDALAKHYLDMGVDTTRDLTTKDEHFTKDYILGNPEQRFRYIAQVMVEARAARDKEREEQFKALPQIAGVAPTPFAPSPYRVLDWGCGHGWSSLYWAGNLGVHVDGLDVDPGAVAWAEHMRDTKFGDAPPACTFTTDQAAIQAKVKAQGLYDAVVIGEVLEHVLDPVAVLQQAEQYVRPGGKVIITVPFGPWEYNGPNWHGFRAHIRELSVADLHDMVGHKPKLNLAAQTQQWHPELGDPCGFTLAFYDADHTAVRSRCLDRKLRVQRPRETVSVNIIANAPAEQTLRWCLDSLKHVADEIVVGDCGLSPAGLQACVDYGAKVVKAPLPLVDGFSAARNAVLDASTMDWVLWVDSDERLMEGQELGKFLRRNVMNGYTLRQVHMAADTQIDPDTPVRLFRRSSGCRFYGLIHEHPELGPNQGPGMVCILGGNPVLWHVGYSSHTVRAMRFMRNRPMLERDRRENPDRALGFYLDARDQLLMAQEMIARANHGRPPNVQHVIPQEALAFAQTCVDLCKKYWDAKVPLAGVSVDPLYWEALRMLGKGFDATVDVRIARDGIGDPGDHRMRFEDGADLERFLKRALQDKLPRVSGPYW